MSIACVFAHPDDETFAIGGTLAMYASRGVRWDLYCATDGDAGKSSGIPVASRADLAALRREELRQAATHLGVHDILFGGHADGALAAVDFDQLTSEIVRFLRARRPAIVITFGPEGAPTGHRDHKAISRAATAAFFLCRLRTAFPEGGAPHAAARLFYVTFDPPAPGAQLQIEGLPATARIDVRAFLSTKREAFLRHATQRQHEPRFIELAMTDHELFAMASGAPQARSVIEDLLEGL
jgi:N-acetylglucosamine malate deacetylase 2